MEISEFSKDSENPADKFSSVSWESAPIMLKSALAILLPAASLAAQLTTGELRARVRVPEAAGQVLLTLRNARTGELRTHLGRGGGEFDFRALPAGTYLLTVEAPGCGTRRLGDLQIPLGTVTLLEVELRKEGEGVAEVAAEADPQRTQVASVIGQDRIQELPIDRRSFVDFSLTVPGVARSSTPVSGAVPNSGLSFRGMNPRQNRFLLDGLDNNDLGTGAPGFPLSQEAVQEFQVVTGAPSAEFGRATGGVVNSVLKSGSNEASGSLFAFHRPGSWDARSAEGSERRSFRQDQIGATVGGPILPDRLFYFASAERFQKQDERVVSIDPVRALPLIAAQGFRVENGSQAFEETLSTGLVKLDYLPDDRNRLGLRVSLAQAYNENQIPWGGITARSAGGTRDSRNGTLALSHQWLGGTDWVNEARFQYARQAAALDSMDPDRTVSVSIAGTALFGTQRLTPQDTRTQYFQFADTATLSRGSHTLKAGIDLLHSRNRGTVEQNSAGVYIFEALSPTIDALDAFSGNNPFGIPLPAAFLQSWGNPTTSFSANSSALFLQDDWQVTEAFLLKLGLRYDREDLPAFDQSVYATLHTPDPARLPDGAIPYSQLFATETDWSSGRLAPRAAFTWQAMDPLRVYGGGGIQSGSTQLGSLFGPRLYNDRDIRTTLTTLLDPGGIVFNPVSWLQPGHRYPAPPPGYLPLLVIPGAYRMPKSTTWNLGFEWTPTSEHRLTVDLLHARTQGLMNVRDVNAYVPDPVTGMPRRPDARFSQILRIDGTGESRYWGQTLAWHWKASPAFALAFGYTHGKAEDNYTDWTPDYPLQNTFDPGQEWGPSAEDQTHQLLLSAVYHTRSRHPLLRDSSVAVIAQYASGRPYSRLVGSDQDQNGDGSADRPAGVGRNSERGPDIKTVDLRLSRAFRARQAKLEVLVEIFNVFNTANVMKVQNVLSAPEPHAYGTVLEYGPMRQFQVGVKATF